MLLLQEDHPNRQEEHEIVQSPIYEKLGNITLVGGGNESFNGLHVGGFTIKQFNAKVFWDRVL